MAISPFSTQNVSRHIKNKMGSSTEEEVQLTNCCDGGSLIEYVSGAHVLDGLGINGLSQEDKAQ